MVKTTEDLARPGPAQRDAGVQKPLHSGLPIEDIRQLARFLSTGECIPRIQTSESEDQGRFVEKVDQVCYPGFLSVVLSQCPFVRKDLPDPQYTKCQVLGHARKSLQRDRPTTRLSCDHWRTREA